MIRFTLQKVLSKTDSLEGVSVEMVKGSRISHCGIKIVLRKRQLGSWNLLFA